MSFLPEEKKKEALPYVYTGILILTVVSFIIATFYLQPFTNSLVGTTNYRANKEVKEYILFSPIFLSGIVFYWTLQLSDKIRQQFAVLLLMFVGLMFVISAIHVYTYYKGLQRGIEIGLFFLTFKKSFAHSKIGVRR